MGKEIDLKELQVGLLQQGLELCDRGIPDQFSLLKSQDKFSDPGTQERLVGDEMELVWILYYYTVASDLPQSRKDQVWNRFSPEYREFMNLDVTKKISSEFKKIFTLRLTSFPDLVVTAPHGAHGSRDKKWMRCTPKKSKKQGKEGSGC
jgi:hypothetical protein